VLGAVLEGRRIRLEPPRTEHLPTFVRWFADPAVTRYLQRRHPPSSRQEAEWLEGVAGSDRDIVWAVALRETGGIIGVIGLHRIDWQSRHAWIEISLGERPAWGQGFGTEAMRLGTAFAFREIGCEKVLASVYSGNDASIRLLEKLGYRQRGLLRRQAFFGGEWHDEWLGEILHEEWKDTEQP
jgi:RimJ/RimL family protein N-acetyltransferase